jgi:uncharacterized phage-associated protein
MLLKVDLELADLVDPKLENIICYFAAKTKYLTEKRLHKLVYTAELYYIEEFCKRLTNIQFKNYNYGVWSPDVTDANMWLDGIKLNIKEEKTEKEHIASFIEPIGDFPFELKEDEIRILDKVLEDWGFETTDELVAFTKSTLPWEESSFGEDVDLGAYVEECKLEDEFFSRKEVIEELDRIDKEGNFVPLR